MIPTNTFSYIGHRSSSRRNSGPACFGEPVSNRPSVYYSWEQNLCIFTSFQPTVGVVSALLGTESMHIYRDPPCFDILRKCSKACFVAIYEHLQGLQMYRQRPETLVYEHLQGLQMFRCKSAPPVCYVFPCILFLLSDGVKTKRYNISRALVVQVLQNIG